jgi:hypothetical protein
VAFYVHRARRDGTKGELCYSGIEAYHLAVIFFIFVNFGTFFRGVGVFHSSTFPLSLPVIRVIRIVALSSSISACARMRDGVVRMEISDPRRFSIDNRSKLKSVRV